MNCVSRSDSWHLAEVNHEVADAAIKAVLIDVPFTAVSRRISVYGIENEYEVETSVIFRADLLQQFRRN